MVIWYISKYTLIPEVHGRGTRQYYLSKYFARQNNEVCLINSESSGFPNQYDSYKAHWYGYSKSKGRLKVFSLKGPKVKLGMSAKRVWSWVIFELLLFGFIFFVKKPKPDVIIVSSLSLLSVINGILAKFVYRAKLVFEIRDIWPKTLVEIGGWKKNHPIIFILDKVENLGYKYSDLIIGTMGNLVEHVKEKSGRYANKVRYVPMGFDPEGVKTIKGEADKRIPVDKFVVAYAGTIGKVNLVEEVVAAARKLQGKKEICFIIIGDGPNKEACLKQAEGLDNISFLGKLTVNELYLSLEKVNLLLHPTNDVSIYRYGVSPNKWIDYMLSGKPILSMYNGYRNIINEAKCGEFIKAHDVDALSSVILRYSKLSKEDLEKIGDNGKNYAYRFLSYDNLAKKYLGFIGENKVKKTKNAKLEMTC